MATAKCWRHHPLRINLSFGIYVNHSRTLKKLSGARPEKEIMKKLFIISMLLLSQPLLADEAAKQNVKDRLNALQTFSATFAQTVTDGSGEELQTAEGKILLSQPQKLYWESMEPNEMLLIADGNTLWHVDPFVEQVIAIDQKDAAQNHPIMLLAQKDSLLWNDYLVEQQGNTFVLTSLDNQSDFISLTLNFDAQRLAGLAILDKMEQLNTLVFSDVTQNGVIDEQRFVFAMPEGFELDDQR